MHTYWKYAKPQPNPRETLLMPSEETGDTRYMSFLFNFSSVRLPLLSLRPHLLLHSLSSTPAKATAIQSDSGHSDTQKEVLIVLQLLWSNQQINQINRVF